MKGYSRARFEDLVGAQTELLRAYVSPIVARSGVAADDALQDGLLRVWREHQQKGLPEDPATRRSYILRSLKCAAQSAIRKEHGEGGARNWIVPADLQAGEAWTDTASSRGSDAADGRMSAQTVAVARAIYRDSDGRAEDERVLERAVLSDALAKLDELELLVITRVAEGVKYKEIADELGVTEAQVNNAANRARALLVGLIEHAGRLELEKREREQLVALLNGELTDRKKRRLAERHLDACALCQRIAAAERGIERSAARVLSPLPALIAAKPLIAVGGAGGGAYAATTAVTSATGSTVATSAVAGSGLLASAGSKVAVVAAIAAAAGGASVAIDAGTTSPTQPPPRVRAVAHLTAAPTVTAARPVLFTKLPSPPRRPRANDRPDKRAEKRPARSSMAPAPQPAQEPTPQPAAQPAPVPAPAAAPATTSQPSKPAASRSSGGEFVIGGGQ